MNKRLLFLLTGMLMCAGLRGAPVGVEQARAVAQDFVGTSVMRPAHGAPAGRLALAYAPAASLNPEYFVFNYGDRNGFVVVAGDDLAPAILGYCDRGDFDYDNLPENARAWFDEYARQIAFLRNHPGLAHGPRKINTGGKEVEPLLDCAWNQSAPFNDLCPMYDSSQRCVTGCVATATAQVMYLHKWPQTGTGSHSYSTSINGTSQTLSADFAHTYDWDNMRAGYNAGYSSEQGQAVARLMSDVGISIDMGYGLSSGASTGSVAMALPKYFGYDASAEYLQRDAYTVNEWEQMIVDECDNGRAVVYSGSSSSGGHAFVVDGYDADGLFHINWGWGGRSNGYFVLTALNPQDQGIGSFEGGYNTRQGMVWHIMPDAGGQAAEPYIFAGAFTLSASSVSLGSSVYLQPAYFTVQGVESTEECYFDFRVSNANGEDFQDYWIGLSGLEGCATYSGVSLPFAPSTDLADGEYRIYCYAEINGVVSKCRLSATAEEYIKMTVSNGTAYFEVPERAAVLRVTAATADAQVPTSAPIDVTATISNTGFEYFDNLEPVLLNTNGYATTTGSAIKAAIPSDGSATVSTRITAPESAGTYTVAFRDASGNYLAGKRPQVVVVAEDAPSLTMNYLTYPADTQPADRIVVETDVTNNGGTFKGDLQLMILVEGQNNILQFATTQMTIGAGETAHVQWTFAIPGAEPGERYTIYARDPNDLSVYRIWSMGVIVTIAEQLERTPLADILASGAAGQAYRVDDKLTIVKSADDLVFATDGNGNWIAIEGGDYQSDLQAMAGIKGGTLTGTLRIDNGNAVLTALTATPVAAVAQEIELRSFDLTTTFDPKPNEIVSVSGYYQSEQGGKLRAYSAMRGKSLFINDSWLGALNLVEGGHYTITGAIRLLEPWDDDTAAGAPRRMRSDDKNSFQNLVMYALEQPQVVTAINAVQATKTPVTTTFVDLTGRLSDRPWTGTVNVVVTRYDDGSTTVTKARY